MFDLVRKDEGTDAKYQVDLSKPEKKANEDVIAPTLSSLSTNYNLMSSNLNSLSKRLGELKTEGSNQGVWGRIFAGELQANFGVKAVGNYVSLQSGYDYGFNIENGRNYVGFALSYTHSSTSQAQRRYQVGLDEYVVGINSAQTNGVEVALYNSVITTSGLYSDSIIKFGYYNSNVDMTLSEKNHNIDNLAIMLSQEVGYKIALGESSEWLITPQVEIAYAFMNKTDLDQTRTVGGLSKTLKSIMEGISTIRTRVGAHWGYSFDHLIAKEKEIKTNFYVGTSYEYDVISGGEVTFEAPGVSQKGNGVKSNGRFVLNVGGNVHIQEATSIYADIESSFGNELSKTYQVNFGVRYAFGEGSEKVVVEEAEKENTTKAPLKIEENKGESKEPTKEAKEGEKKQKVGEKGVKKK